MAIKYSDAVRNAKADATETAIGTSPVLKFRTGSPPANVAAAATGTVLATLTLPANWMDAASGGVKSKHGSWTVAAADADGTAGHFEITASDGTTRHMQGTVTAAGGGGDMTVSNVEFVTGQPVEVLTFTLTEGNG